MKPLNTENLLSFYVPVNGLISYSALSINIMNPTLRTRWVQYYATWNLREFNSFVYLKILRFGWFDKFSPLAHCCWHWMLHLHTKAFAEGSSSEEDRILVSHRQSIQINFEWAKTLIIFALFQSRRRCFVQLRLSAHVGLLEEPSAKEQWSRNICRYREWRSRCETHDRLFERYWFTSRLEANKSSLV